MNRSINAQALLEIQQKLKSELASHVVRQYSRPVDGLY